MIGDGCDIGPDTQLDSCVVGAKGTVRQTVATDAEIGDGAIVGPFAHLGPGSSVVAGAVTGAFYTAPIDN